MRAPEAKLSVVLYIYLSNNIFFSIDTFVRYRSKSINKTWFKLTLIRAPESVAISWVIIIVTICTIVLRQRHSSQAAKRNSDN